MQVDHRLRRAQFNGPVGRALDHAADARRLVAAVQRADALADLGVGLGDALVVADIFDPGRRVVASRSTVRGFSRSRSQRPVAARRRGGGCGRRSAITARNSGTSSSPMTYSMVIAIGPLRGFEVERQLRLLPAVERVEVERGCCRQRQHEAEARAGQHATPAAISSASSSAVRLGDDAPDPAAQRHAAEGGRLVERQRPADHPARRRHLHRDVEDATARSPSRRRRPAAPSAGRPRHGG